MVIKKIVLCTEKISLDKLSKFINSTTKDLDKIIIKEKEITIEIYSVIPLAILTTFKTTSLEGFSKRTIFLKIYQEINSLFRKLDPYKSEGIWGTKIEEIEFNYILYYPKLNKIKVSVS
ncbi:MAG: hypothetical protein ACFFCI_20130 [Promethearchaeota archaeon]